MSVWSSTVTLPDRSNSWRLGCVNCSTFPRRSSVRSCRTGRRSQCGGAGSASVGLVSVTVDVSAASPAGFDEATIKAFRRVVGHIEREAGYFTSPDLEAGQWVFFDVKMGYGTVYRDTGLLPPEDDVRPSLSSTPRRSRLACLGVGACAGSWPGSTASGGCLGNLNCRRPTERGSTSPSRSRVRIPPGNENRRADCLADSRQTSGLCGRRMMDDHCYPLSSSGCSSAARSPGSTFASRPER